VVLGKDLSEEEDEIGHLGAMAEDERLQLLALSLSDIKQISISI